MNIRNLWLATALVCISVVSMPAFGQATTTNGGTGSGTERGHRLNFLSREDKVHLLRVRRQVFEADPALKTEAESLRKDMRTVKAKGSDGAGEDKATLRRRMREHREKMDAAMLKADPTIQPVLDQIKAHVKQRLGQGGAANDDDSGNP